MKYQFIPYLIPLSISFFILLFLAYYGFRHCCVRGARAFSISMFIGSLWTLSNGLEMAGLELSIKFFWANMQYIAYGFSPVVWFVMVLEFTDRPDWVNKKNILLMSIIPLITIILVWTDHIHGLVRTGFSLDSSGVFPVISKDYGPWFWVHSTYSYLLNISAIILLFRTVLLKNTVYQKQAFHLLIGFFIITFFNLLYISGLSPFKGFDISPLTFSVAGIIFGWGIFHFRLFDLVPIARETVIEKMGSGIIVVDRMKRLIDINPQARKSLHLSEKVDIGQALANISPELEGLIPEEEDDSLSQTEFTLIDEDNEKHYYEIYLSLIRDYRKEHIAWVLILNDITDLKMAREQINQQKQELAVMDERGRMARDLHDNLGQILSFSSIQIQAVRQELKKDNQDLADQYLKRLNEIIKDAHKDIREYVYNIRNNSYYKKGFIFLMKKEIAEFKENSNLEIKLKIPERLCLDSLGTEEKMQLLHIVKEALTNVLKYAEADTVTISLNKKEDAMKMSIADNGKGIDETFNSGSGLSIMHERAHLIGGQLKISSKAGRGTKIIVSIKTARHYQ